MDIDQEPSNKVVGVDWTGFDERKIDDFMSKGGIHPESNVAPDNDHRLTLRIPKWFVEKIEEKRAKNAGKISRTLWIVEQLERSVR